ncbi:xanthine dehydrogenase accessory protein XdhC [Alteromonas genovensis]|uniref:Xanthine dehydrogenase accessory protein XdhC n=1 Tax=Alteromonas genovensis TaxID=471225 RepID=A0A6N9TCP9_9ALTE|nr:xanthine dehydrogenase accessory protein XdhC [Alteromonas genovensis]NDW14950.1 xanthine dehydrogenase accessory protein XdhC [Alteromonas genovensis]
MQNLTWRAKTWHEGIAQCQQHNVSYVLVTVVSVAGSAPRETGSKMVVTASESIDTIGGGNLEHHAIATAREFLLSNQPLTELRSYPLSSKLGQCCGGAVKVLFDVCNSYQQHIAVFGAGHVAKALVPILSQLPVNITWIDSRESLFSNSGINNADTSALNYSGLPDNVNIVVEQEPETEVAQLAPGSWLVILTHDHQLDYRITEQALKYPSLPFVGLIGSQTKAKRFITKLSHRGFDDAALARLYTPIGNPSIPGKRPIEVAVSISAQLIALLHCQSDKDSTQTADSASTFTTIRAATNIRANTSADTRATATANAENTAGKKEKTNDI